MRRRGVAVKLRGIRRVRQDGKVYRYHRASGTRLPDDLPEDHPEFIAAWQAAETGASSGPNRIEGPPGTIAAAWLSYAASPRYRALAPSYAASIRRHAQAICKTGGTVAIRTVQARHIRADLSGLDPNPARMRLKAWRAIMAHAVAAGLIADNPAELVKAPREASTPHEPWTPADLAAFRAHWPVGSQPRTAFELLQWTGARISDVVRMGPGMVDHDGWLTFRQQKTGGKVSIPLRRTPPAFADPADLAQLIEALPRGVMTWLETRGGAARSHKAASSWFARAARKAGVAAPKSAHGLRSYRAIALAEAGATTHQIAAWTGHKSLSEVQHYSQAAESRRLLTGPEGERILFRSGNPEQKNAASD